MNKQKFKSICITILTVFLAYVIQCSIVRYIKLASIGPNLLIIITASYAIMHGQLTGMMVGFFTGLLIDIQFGEITGLYAFIYMITGFFCGIYHQHYSRENLRLPMAVISISEFIYGLVICLLMFILRGKFHFILYLTHNILPELIYTFLISFPVYILLLYIDQKLEISEKRSAS